MRRLSQHFNPRGLILGKEGRRDPDGGSTPPCLIQGLRNFEIVAKRNLVKLGPSGIDGGNMGRAVCRAVWPSPGDDQVNAEPD
jgi:hypothetical protein